MKTVALVVLTMLVLVFAVTMAPACGSSGLSCQNPTSMQQTCINCLNSSCNENITNLDSDCPGAVSCVEACNCGDAKCAQQCGGADAGSACTGDLLGLEECGTQMCKSQCVGVFFF